MTDSSKEPSKGAMRAARMILAKFGKVHDDWAKTCAEIIDRETKAGQMADLLRELAEYFKASLRRPEFAHQLADDHPLVRAERLLTDLYPNEEKG